MPKKQSLRQQLRQVRDERDDLKVRLDREIARTRRLTRLTADKAKHRKVKATRRWYNPLTWISRGPRAKS